MGWIRDAADKMKKKGTVGAFTKQAHSAGYSSPMSYARHVLAHKGAYSTQTIRRAAFAINANKRKK